MNSIMHIIIFSFDSENFSHNMTVTRLKSRQKKIYGVCVFSIVWCVWKNEKSRENLKVSSFVDGECFVCVLTSFPTVFAYIIIWWWKVSNHDNTIKTVHTVRASIKQTLLSMFHSGKYTEQESDGMTATIAVAAQYNNSIILDKRSTRCPKPVASWIIALRRREIP